MSINGLWNVDKKQRVTKNNTDKTTLFCNDSYINIKHRADYTIRWIHDNAGISTIQNKRIMFVMYITLEKPPHPLAGGSTWCSWIFSDFYNYTYKNKNTFLLLSQQLFKHFFTHWKNFLFFLLKLQHYCFLIGYTICGNMVTVRLYQ